MGDCYRNGSWIFAPGWLCTDPTGSAKKGPWSWSSTPGDQTDDPCYIRWPNGDTTNNAFHIWDKNYAVTYRDSPWGSPPTSYYGHATDAQWGAGFDFGGSCFSFFRDLTSNLWWNKNTGSYGPTGSSLTNPTTRVNRWSINWSGPFPSPGAHVSGHTYEWTTCCDDGGAGQCTVGQFTKP